MTTTIKTNAPPAVIRAVLREALCDALAARVGDDGTGDLGVIVEARLDEGLDGVTVDELVKTVLEARQDAAVEAEREDVPRMFRYTIFDGDPSSSGPCAWPGHSEVELVATSSAVALEAALSVADIEGSTCGEYAHGDRLWVLVWDADDELVADGVVTLELAS